MKKQLSCIIVLLFCILLMIGYGDKAFFDLSFHWSAVFAVIGAICVAAAFIHGGKD